MSAKKKALGKGLSALLENANTDITSNKRTESKLVGSVSSILIENIEANPFQPRINFEKEPLLELAESIKQNGIIQPVTVRKLGYDEYQLISGERRFRATQIAGLKEIPAFIRVANDQAMLEMAIVENIQRENLDAIEIAISYQRLIDECNLTQEQLSEKVGKSRTAVTNFLRLLKLPAEIQLGIREKKLNMGHARALVSVKDEKKQIYIYRQAIDNGWSVRQVELAVRGLSDEVGKENKTSKSPLSFEHQKVKDDLTKKLSTGVKLNLSPDGKGKIVIPFNSNEDLQRIFNLLDD